MDATTQTDRRGLFVTLVYALLTAAALFLFLVSFTGEIFIAVLAALILIFVVGGFHYLVWGRTMAGHAPVVYSRRVEAPADEFPDNFNLTLDDRERAELLGLLDRCTPSETPERQAILRGVRERLERFGA